MNKYPSCLDSEVLILIKNEEEYDKVKLILHTYGIKEYLDHTFKSFLSTHYYLKIFNKRIYQGSRRENLRLHEKFEADFDGCFCYGGIHSNGAEHQLRRSQVCEVGC